MSILSNNDINLFTGAAIELFDTASQWHSLTIFKEPTKTIINVNANEYNGYGGYNTNPDNYTLVQSSGTYNVVVVSVDKTFKDTSFDPIPSSLPRGQKEIKVSTVCKNYIEEGKNILFLLDGQEYVNISNPRPQNYGGLVYFHYLLERTS